MKRSLLLAALLACIGGAHAQQAAPSGQELAWMQAAQGAQRAWLGRIAPAIAADGDARALALAALLREAAQAAPAEAAPQGNQPSRPVPADAQARNWRQAAVAEAGQDVLAAALLLRNADADQRLRLAQRWLAAEPDNLAPLLFRGGAAEALLSDARNARRFDLHIYDQVRWLRSQLLRHAPTTAERAALDDGDGFHPEEHAAHTAMALWSQGMPAMQPLIEACSAQAVRASAQRRGDCLHVAQLLQQRSDTALGRSLGIAMLRQLAVGAAERQAIEAEGRRLDWQMQQWGEAAAGQARDGAAQFARLLDDTSIRSEQQMAERVLGEAGIATEPPAGWTSPWQQR